MGNIVGFWSIGKPVKDENTARCDDCGWEGLAYEAGAPDIPPMEGTENWTKEQIKQWKKDFSDGKIKITESLGCIVHNAKGLDNIRFLDTIS